MSTQISAPNYTQIPNLLLDEFLPLMKECEMRVTLAICRQTFGWHREKQKISLSFLEKATGMHRKEVSIGLKEGMERGTIGREPTGLSDNSFFYFIIIKESLLVGNSYQGVVGNSYPKKEREERKDPPPLRSDVANAPSSLRGSPPKPPPDPKPRNDDEVLRNNFKKSLKLEEIERAIKYFNDNRSNLGKYKNPIGFVVTFIREGKDLIAKENEQIIEKRKAFAKNCEYTTPGGYCVVTSTGIEKCSGSQCWFTSFDGNDSHWDNIGLGLKPC